MSTMIARCNCESEFQDKKNMGKETDFIMKV